MLSPKITTVACTLALVAGSPVALAQPLTPIGVSYQPAVYWALPYHLASEKGWWKEVGLEPQFSTFPSGAPQMAAAASKSWDVGGTGSAPATLGAQRFDILTIGITNDESVGNAIMARNSCSAPAAISTTRRSGRSNHPTRHSSPSPSARARV